MSHCDESLLMSFRYRRGSGTGCGRPLTTGTSQVDSDDVIMNSYSGLKIPIICYNTKMLLVESSNISRSTLRVRLEIDKWHLSTTEVELWRHQIRVKAKSDIRDPTLSGVMSAVSRAVRTVSSSEPEMIKQCVGTGSGIKNDVIKLRA